MHSLKTGLRPLLGLLVSGLFLWLAFRRVQVEALLALAQAWPVIPIGLSLLFQAVAFILRLIRWGWINRQLGEVGWGRLWAIGSVGLGAVFLLPVRLGEVVRPALVSMESKVDFGRGSAAIVLERLVDGWIMGTALSATLLALGDRAESSALRLGASFFAGALLVASATFALATVYWERVAAVLGVLLGRVSTDLGDRLSLLAGQFLVGLRGLSAAAILPRFALISVAMWMAEAASIFMLFGVLDAELPWLAALTVLSALVLGTTLPSGPAHLGVFEFAVVLGLGVFGVEANAATAYGLLLHALETLAVLAFGLAGVWAGGLRLRRIAQVASTAQARARELAEL